MTDTKRNSFLFSPKIELDLREFNIWTLEYAVKTLENILASDPRYSKDVNLLANQGLQMAHKLMNKVFEASEEIHKE